jgi:hypothetical protein
MIGYTVQVQTGIKISPISPTTVTFALESTVLALGQTVQVIGEKPLFETDITASQQRISSEEISQKVVENLNDLVADQLGVVMQDNKIHIRGGRADESMYVIDGQSVKDPLSGYSNTLYVNASAIKELKVITGGFNAEYGQAMSGIVDIETKEGEEEFSGSVIYKTDNAFSGFIDGFNTDIAQVNLGGPEPISTNLLRGIGIRLPGQVSFFFSGYTHLSDSYLPAPTNSIHQRANMKNCPTPGERWHLLGKLTWNLRPGQKLSYSYDRSVNINQGYFIANISGNRGYPYEYEKMLDNYNTFTKEALLNTLQWVHTLNPRTYYRLSLSRFYTGIHSAVQNKEWTEYEERLDLEPVYYIPDSQGNIQTRFGDGFWIPAMQKTGTIITRIIFRSKGI